MNPRVRIGSLQPMHVMPVSDGDTIGVLLAIKGDKKGPTIHIHVSMLTVQNHPIQGSFEKN